MSIKPLVSLGMPVFNGAAHMRRALDSLLDQTLRDFELIISDNGSDDATQDIARAYMAQDSRISLWSQRNNRGASWNFDRVFRLSVGRYFVWTAADDYWDPKFLEACVNELEDRPDVVTCVPEIQPVSALGVPVGDAFTDLAVEAAYTRDRWRAALCNTTLHSAVYGVMRRAALARTRLVLPFVGSDHVLMTELVLQGSVVQVPQVLAYKTVPAKGERYRTHAEMVRYLGGDGGAPWFLWLQLVGHLARGAYHLRPIDASPLLLSADAIANYFTSGDYRNDMKLTIRRLVERLHS